MEKLHKLFMTAALLVIGTQGNAQNILPHLETNMLRQTHLILDG